ncbi:MAG: acyltransferase [Bacteroidota bacterium]
MILPNLNPLRFFLALLVMLVHIPEFFRNRGLPTYNDGIIFHRGKEAVYVFFVLSGFLIIRLLYKEVVEKGSISLRSFYIRRILRIYPLYFLILITGFLYYKVVLSLVGIPYEADYDLTNALLLFVFFLPNVAANLYQPGGALEILWSIGIEEQFYLLIPPMLFFIKRAFFIRFIIILTVVYFFIFASDIFPFLRRFDFLYFYFSAGGLFAVLHERYDLGSKMHKYLKIAILATFIAYFCTNIFKGMEANVYHFVSMLLFSITIMTLSYSPVINIQNKQLNYLGKISYGIYMFHPLVMQLIGLVMLKLVANVNLSDITIILLSYGLVFGVTFIVSHFSYQYFEKPFLNLKNKFR